MRMRRREKLSRDEFWGLGVGSTWASISPLKSDQYCFPGIFCVAGQARTVVSSFFFPQNLAINILCVLWRNILGGGVRNVGISTLSGAY